MRLKSIKLAGFKSFVDPTTTNFPENLTAVVGPNGCGKSNIIDAVRWVMGESSAKHLRGESMADVIFNGSNARKPVAQASIELIFDNSDATVTGEYGKFNEISVKRQVTRDGQSNYFLNGTKCRRKDIADIFLGTGLGPRSYAIIEQGMISRLIEAKPEELRVYIEEAAGISKYKARRRETENRIRRTRENLERLTDIRDELERQLERLSRQASAAEKYKQYKEEERLKGAQLKALRWKGLDSQVKQLDFVIGELDVSMEAKVAEQRHVDAEVERLREKHHEVQEHFNQVQQHFYALGAEVARLEQSIQHQRERKQQLYEELDQIKASWQESDEHLRVDSEKVAELDAILAEREPELELISEQQEASAEALALAEEAMQNWQQEWEEFNGKSGESRRQAEVEQSRIQHLEKSQDRLKERIERLRKEQESLDSGPLAQEMRQLEEQVEQYRGQSEENELRSESLQEDINRMRRENGDRGRQLDEAREKLQTLKGRRTSLEALQKAAMGDDGAVSDWLNRHELDAEPRLADQVQVDEGWEKALEAVLGDSIQAVAISGFDQVSDWLGDLSHGRLALFSPASVKGTGSKGKLLRDHVQGQVPEGLLAGVYVADDLNGALALRGQLDAHESVVTRDGICLGPDWLKVAKEEDQEAGILERRRELEQLEGEIETLQATVDDLKEQLESTREQIGELEEEREEVQRQASRINRELGEINAQVSARQVRLEQITMRRERLGRELEETNEQHAQEQEQMKEARAVLAEALDAMEADSGQREALLSRRDELRLRLDEARQKARHDRDQSHHLAMEVQGARTQADSLRQNLSRLESQVQALAERKALLEEQTNEGDEPGTELQMQLEEKLEVRLEAEHKLTEARRELEAVDHEMRNLEGQRGQFERQAQEIRSTMDQKRMQWQDLTTRRQTVAEQLGEHNFDLDTVLENLPEDANEQEWAREMDMIGQRISRLGQINLAAIDEYQQQSERKNYLDSQNGDLEDALNTLENAIRKIDRETRARFKEYFDRINRGLQELFPKVFGGGHAYLELTGDDLLDTGVTIMARPPGKRNSTIHLLSGGEKALTALSLVFSIFQLNPAPFCLLDEVDAPLDDANVGRFCNLVSEMSAKVQFIYITHNKIAMEMAATLMGVTMHEPGVSRLVSVDVEEAAEMAAM
ncbi:MULTISPECIES: chromosome segregation protein SMC [unclassified Alcanivorax]|jgi:chromosome segregation protein|uniref:chromosome segregation protein SMC n=1 Tax=unclassified Alcanivorax TaxID=2638842 RepID=UPI0007B8AC2C|nr:MULTISPECIES: chromosome segregation protein SMC [unclassified Alcanivorax]KZX85240.1 chromosome segregation protein SMC [Alcanivorax sp. HI0011]KZX93660.1 chromosome segregation protein SMC [Alcanivorax sp. HI0013]KZY19935.1 chromosome segregation protein SMC [Alcanivorax sp. HI0035]KZX61865.1 chromosome segregation protein SMC [Alcanivorax sp. HI0003]KZX67358.1 chromosome segregation protein SMC [Alcanivorax sp. HI0007]